MIAVVLAAGRGTRMWPLTGKMPKHILPVGGEPLIRRTVRILTGLGVSPIVVVVGYSRGAVERVLPQGVIFARQEEQRGTAHALLSAREYINDDFLLVNGDLLLDQESVSSVLEGYDGSPVVGAVSVEDPSRYGVLEVRNGHLTGLVEKPERPPGNLINAGVYALPQEALQFVSGVRPSPRGELEFTDAVLAMTSEYDVRVVELGGLWMDLAAPWDLLKANEAVMRSEMVESRIDGEVESGAHISGPVWIEKDALVRSGAYIEGPVFIGRGAKVGPNCYIRPCTSIGENCHIGASVEIKNSVIMNGSNAPHHNYVGDSVIGERCNLGAGTKVANLRLDGKPVRSYMRGKRVSTGRRKLGVIMGSDVKVGINASIDPGTVVGNDVFIGPGTRVRGLVKDGAVVL